jgi:hypothetical protein
LFCGLSAQAYILVSIGVTPVPAAMQTAEQVALQVPTLAKCELKLGARQVHAATKSVKVLGKFSLQRSQSGPADIPEECTEVSAVIRPGLLSPAVGRRPSREFFARLGCRATGNHMGVHESPIVFSARRPVGDTPGTDVLDIFDRVEREPVAIAARTAAHLAADAALFERPGLERIRMVLEWRQSTSVFGLHHSLTDWSAEHRG